MMRSRTGWFATLVALGLAGSSAPAAAATFFGWQVVDVPAGDLLNVRAFPSNRSRTLVGYANGTRLSLTGRCTGGLNLDAINGQPAWRQRQAVRSRWCEVWFDPTGNGQWRQGWAYGRFIRPL